MTICKSFCRVGVAAGLSMALLGCVTTSPHATKTNQADKYDAAFKGCLLAGQDEPVVGNWLSVRKEAGVAGEIRLQIRLHADGSMHYVEQLKRGNKPPQTLSEIGCWYKEGSDLVLRTTHSNGSQVEASDPIYIQHHAIGEVTEKGMVLNMDGKDIRLRRTKPDYRLPIL